MNDPVTPDGPLDDDDLAVFGQVHDLYQAADPVPPVLYTRVRFALDLEDAERELATICADLGPALAVRGPEQTRTITFEAETITITITITPQEDGTSRFDGWLFPGEQLAVELRTTGPCRHTHADGNGRFVIEGIPPGEAQLAVLPTAGCTVALSRVVVTQPIVL